MISRNVYAIKVEVGQGVAYLEKFNEWLGILESYIFLLIFNEILLFPGNGPEA